MIDLKQIAKKLDQAAANAKSVEQISTHTPISLEDAYAIQKLSLQERYERDEELIGYKMGFTSKAKMEQMGVHDLIWGRLTNYMHIENNGEMDMEDFIHPRVEPEIAFLISKDIEKEIDLEDLSEYVEGVASAIEVIDSRYKNFKFSLEDVIADNCSSSGFVIGDWSKNNVEIKDVKISIAINGEIVHSGSSKAILDNPWNSLQEATRLITAAGETIRKGQIILAGAATPAIYVKEKDIVEVQVEGLSTVNLKTA